MPAPKENQPDLLTAVTDTFAVATKPDTIDRTVEKDHGRFEVRVCETISDPAVIAWLDPDTRWAGLCTIARMMVIRQVGMHDPTTIGRYS